MAGTTPNLSLPYPTPDDTVDVPRDVKALADALDLNGKVPVGGMMMWPVAAAPSGWLLMQGQKVPVSQYPGLAALLGDDGAGMVTIPDWRDRFPVAVGPTMALNAQGGASTVTLLATESGMPSHNHGGVTGVQQQSLAHAHDLHTAGNLYAPGGNGYSGMMQRNSGTYVGSSNDGDIPAHTHAISTEAARNATAAHENRPPFRGVNFIIRAG